MQVDDPRFEKFVLFLICLSSILMALEGPNDARYLQGPDKKGYRWSINAANSFLVFMFWMEAICKIVADGFLRTPSAYLKNGWNRIDFFIVLTATADVVLSSVAEARTIRSIRVLRVLRPLRAMKTNETMSMILEAITKCIPTMFGALCLSGIFYLTFAIFGVSLFMGKFYRCDCGGETSFFTSRMFYRPFQRLRGDR